MELLTDGLRQKIIQLIALDEERQSAILKEGISYFSVDRDQVEARQEYNGYAESLASVVDGLNDVELIVVTALTTYGNARASADDNDKFADAMEDAFEFVSTSERSHVIASLSAKRLSEYLPVGLRRAKLDGRP